MFTHVMGWLMNMTRLVCESQRTTFWIQFCSSALCSVFIRLLCQVLLSTVLSHWTDSFPPFSLHSFPPSLPPSFLPSFLSCLLLSLHLFFFRSFPLSSFLSSFSVYLFVYLLGQDLNTITSWL